jgi:hypothetical protein
LRASVQLSQTEIHVSRHIERASGATSTCQPTHRACIGRDFHYYMQKEV